MKRLALLVALTLVSFASQAQEAPIDARAVWRPGAQFMPTVRERCSSAASGRYGECLIAQMPGAGASRQAVAFSQRLVRESGQTGYASGFQAAGPTLGIASVVYPLRANENLGWLIVNGEPPSIDVDDADGWPYEGLAHDARFKALRERHPRIAIFPGDRSGPPRVEPLADGGRRVVVGYRLLDGCHACARLGAASFGFDFDAANRFLGTTLLGVE